MQLFYYDDTIKNFESQGNFKELLKYLEKLPFSDSVFATQLSYAWYLYIEGDFVNEDVSNDWDFYFNKFIEKINYAINYCKNSPISCLIIAYTLEISGMCISDYVKFDYEIESQKFYNLCFVNSKDDELTALCKHLSSNRETDLPSSYLKLLFPNNSLIDKYFKTVL